MTALALARLQRAVVFGWLALVVGWFVYHAQRGEWLRAIAGAVAIAAAHAAFLALEFACAQWVNRSDPAPRASLRQVRAAWWAEVRVAMRVFCWHQPFQFSRHPDYLPDAAEGRRGVVLVHGFACNRAFWNDWMPVLRRAGIPHIAVNLEPAFGDIDGYPPIVDAAVRRLHAVTKMPPLLVGHSMGGLALRAWLATQGEVPRISGIVTLGTPHSGTRWAALALQNSARQMRPQSPWLQSLADAEGRGLAALFTCYYSHCDNIVIPASAAVLPGAAAHHIVGAGHVDLMQRPEVLSDVLQRLRGD